VRGEGKTREGRRVERRVEEVGDVDSGGRREGGASHTRTNLQVYFYQTRRGGRSVLDGRQEPLGDQLLDPVLAPLAEAFLPVGGFRDVFERDPSVGLRGDLREGEGEGEGREGEGERGRGREREKERESSRESLREARGSARGRGRGTWRGRRGYTRLATSLAEEKESTRPATASVHEKSSAQFQEERLAKTDFERKSENKKSRVG
jgi:hypothetical protein